MVTKVSMKISRVESWLVAVPFSRPIRSAYGISYPARVRVVIRLTTDAGITGIGETGPSAVHPFNLDEWRTRFDRESAPVLLGLDPFHPTEIRRRLRWSGDAVAAEMACYDIMGKADGRKVCELLGGVPGSGEIAVAGYAFYHVDLNGHSDQGPLEIVGAVEKMVHERGFQTVKLKLGVYDPAVEVELVRTIRRAHPDIELRVDANGAWSVPMALRVMKELSDVDLQYIEDPIKDSPLGLDLSILSGRTIDFEGFRRLRGAVPIPLCADNCYRLDLLREIINRRAADVVLADVFGCGGLSPSLRWLAVADTFHLGLGMHSGSELGIGQLAKAHVVAAMEGRLYAMDSIYEEYVGDVLAGGKIKIRDGLMSIPDSPGLGADLDEREFARFELTASRKDELDAYWAELRKMTKTEMADSSLLAHSF